MLLNIIGCNCYGNYNMATVKSVKGGKISKTAIHLYAISVKGKTSQLWVDSLIKPMFAILKYIRTEREAD